MGQYGRPLAFVSSFLSFHTFTVRTHIDAWKGFGYDIYQYIRYLSLGALSDSFYLPEDRVWKGKCNFSAHNKNFTTNRAINGE